MSEDVISYQRSSYIQNKNKNTYSRRFTGFLNKNIKNGFGTNLIGFLIARSVILGGLAPFGLAYYCALLGSNANMFILFFSVNVGIITTGITIVQMKYILSSTILSILNIISPIKKSTSIAFRTFVAIFIVGNITIFYRGFLLYDFILNIFESSIIFIFILLFRNGVKYFESKEKLKKPTIEQLISITIMMIIAIIGISNISILGLQIKSILIILLIMIFSLHNGPSIGTTIGLIAGLIVSVSSGMDPIIIGVYGFCGLLSGIFKSLGKAGVIIGFFIANIIITMYINGSTEVLIHISSIIVAAIIFLLIPSAVIDIISQYYIPSVSILHPSRSEIEKIKDITTRKLNNFADSFYALANTFNHITENNFNVNTEDTFTIFEEVAERVCKDCTYNANCWGKRSIETYQIMSDILSKIQNKGHITRFDVPQHFRGRCIRLDNYISNINYMYDLYNANLLWKKKVFESKSIISQQINVISRVINNFAEEFDSEIFFEGVLEKKIQTELLKHEIQVHEVMVIKNKNRKYEVTIAHKPLDDKTYAVNIVEIVSDILDKKMIKDEMKNCDSDDMCITKLCEPKNFRVITGVSSMSKKGNEISGDSYTAIELEEGRHILAISDGMGSGQRAATESNTMLNLLEKFLKNGIDKNLAIKLINSILVLNSTQDTFTTIDLSIIDLFSANVEFIKNGAAATFIKRNNKVEIINSTSLPVGILKNIDLEVTKRSLEDEDIIVMVSDGVIDSKKDVIDKEKWIATELLNSNISNPKLFADYLIEKSKANYNNKEIDDMTVIVAKISEKIC